MHLYATATYMSYAQVYPNVKSSKLWKNATSVDSTGFEHWSGNVHNFSYAFKCISINIHLFDV